MESAAPELQASCAIAFGEHVLAQCLDGLAGDDTPADRRLDHVLEELALAQGRPYATACSSERNEIKLSVPGAASGTRDEDRECGWAAPP